MLTGGCGRGVVVVVGGVMGGVVVGMDTSGTVPGPVWGSGGVLGPGSDQRRSPGGADPGSARLLLHL